MAIDRMVRLDLEEWQRVLGILSTAPWATANPLIMKIGEQLRMQEPRGLNDPVNDAAAAARPRGNGVDETAP
jgi:hypothetical protein